MAVDLLEAKFIEYSKALVSVLTDNGRAVEAEKKKAANHINKSLGILVEDGLYGFVVYQEIKKNEKMGKHVANHCGKLAAAAGISGLTDEGGQFDDVAIQAVCKNLDKLMFLREIFEQLLTYSRWCLKIKDNQE